MADKEKDSEEKPFEYLKLAIWLTIGYMALIGLLGTLPWYGNSECTKHTWLSVFQGCLTFNELGDFLAGAFAPVAFIWLAAAVLIQSQELKEQRKELRLTRESMEDNREVMKAQADEARKQAEYIGQQTKILQEQQRERRDENQTRIFDVTIEKLVGSMLDDPISLLFHIKGDPSSQFGCGDMTEEILAEPHPYHKARIVSKNMNVAAIELKKLTDTGFTAELVPMNLNSFKNAYEAIAMAQTTSEDLNDVARFATQPINLERMFDQVSEMAQLSGLE